MVACTLTVRELITKLLVLLKRAMLAVSVVKHALLHNGILRRFCDKHVLPPTNNKAYL